MNRAMRWTVLLLLIACAGFAPRAFAAEDCTVTASGVAFGTYDPGSATPLDGQGTVQVDCRGNPLLVTITLGTGGSGSYAARRMTNGTDNLFYNLYLDANRTVIFGNGTGGSLSGTCTTGEGFSSPGCTSTNPSGSHRRAVRAIYGRVNASQNVGVGLYTDTITYTVTF
jgi:spore coat protein U-like protein